MWAGRSTRDVAHDLARKRPRPCSGTGESDAARSIAASTPREPPPPAPSAATDPEPRTKMTEPAASDTFVANFRASAPYIHAHRGRTFVVVVGGEAFGAPGLRPMLHDVALLLSLGVRVVLVAGARPQIDAGIARRGHRSHYAGGLRVTDEIALECVKEAAGTNRVELEALLSMGLPSSPMAGVASSTSGPGSKPPAWRACAIKRTLHRLPSCSARRPGRKARTSRPIRSPKRCKRCRRREPGDAVYVRESLF